MKTIYEVNTVTVLSDEIRKALSEYNDPAAIAVKLLLLQKQVPDITHTQRLINKFSVTDE